MKRRKMIKSAGAIALGVTAPGLAKGEYMSEPFRTRNDRISTDILVVGGGTAGTIAAIQAARAGMGTILIESGSQLGGTTTTGGVSFPGIFHAWGRQIIGGIGWELVMECVHLNAEQLPEFSYHPERHWENQVAVNAPLYTLLAEEKCLEAGVDIRYYETPGRIEFRNGKWEVETVGKGIRTTITCKQVIDCTGNALIASMAGFSVLRENETQPGSLVYRIGGYDLENLDLEKIPKEYHKHLYQNRLTGNVRTGKKNTFIPYGYVYVFGADSTTSVTHTLANRQGRSTLLKLVRELRTYPGCENIRILDLKTETAVRETFRIDGLYRISRQDYLEGKLFDDALSYSFYPIDLHREGKTIHQEFLEPGVVASVPLRALIPRESRNFLVAGRCVSSDRMANSALRVQASCMGMGQAAAAAAVLACKHETTPAEVPVTEIKGLLADHGAIIPGQS